MPNKSSSQAESHDDERMERIKAEAREYALQTDEYKEFCKHLQDLSAHSLIDGSGTNGFDEDEDDEEEDFVLEDYEDDDFLDLWSPDPTLTPAEPENDERLLQDAHSSPGTESLLPNDFYQDLAEELEQLQTEDMEAAVASLIHNDPVSTVASSPSQDRDIPPSTPLRDAARAPQTLISDGQYSHLQELLRSHYQLLMQQTVLCVRAVHSLKTHQPRTPETCVLESLDDLVEIMDAAVHMLQDLRTHRVDAVRNTANTALFTRAQFRHFEATAACPSVFNIPGLENLPQTFITIENNVASIMDRSRTSVLGTLATPAGCRKLLSEAGAHIDEEALPGADVSTAFSQVTEFLGPDFKPNCTPHQQVVLRKNRNLFTSGEDNLVLRGVNLYGEKQWSLIAHRFLPDRSINIISQRYNKLCLLIYRANGIPIDAQGNLVEPCKMDSVDDLDETALSTIQKVPPPAVLNVHRWSMEEDLTLLRTVPLMGNMWAELGARFLPHRDRGHLRKRYQVLQRRVKATQGRAQRFDYLRIPTTLLATPPKNVSKAKFGNERLGPFARPSNPFVPNNTASSSDTMASAADTTAAAILAGARNGTPQKKRQRPRNTWRNNNEEEESQAIQAISELAKSPAKSLLPEDTTTRLDFLEEPSGLSALTFSPAKRRKLTDGQAAPPTPSTPLSIGDTDVHTPQHWKDSSPINNTMASFPADSRLHPPAGNSLDGYDYAKVFDETTSAKPSNLFDGAGLETDAISALSQLSSTPPTAAAPSKTSDAERKKPKSLFATVVGGKPPLPKKQSGRKAK